MRFAFSCNHQIFNTQATEDRSTMVNIAKKPLSNPDKTQTVSFLTCLSNLNKYNT